MQGEVKTLKSLAAGGVRVTEPFATGQEGEILFSLNVFNEDKGEEIKYPAFLQRSLPVGIGCPLVASPLHGQ